MKILSKTLLLQPLLEFGDPVFADENIVFAFGIDHHFKLVFAVDQDLGNCDDLSHHSRIRVAEFDAFAVVHTDESALRIGIGDTVLKILNHFQIRQTAFQLKFQ